MVEKPSYGENSVQLVALSSGKVVGLLDAELIEDEQYFELECIAVLPEFQYTGIGTQLFERLKASVKEKRMNRIEAWTREDEAANRWYSRQGFTCFQEYWNIYSDTLPSDMPVKLPKSLNPTLIIWSYTGDNPDDLGLGDIEKNRCRGYELFL